MFSAKRHIAVIGAEQNLFPAAHNTVLVNTRIAGCLFAAPADGFDFPNRIRNGNQPRTPRKELVLKICAKSVAHDWHVHKIHNI